jgi:ABC-type transport system involved in multi-copper enzyme maturation permease subunit
MLLKKFWLETKNRFYIGIVFIAALCIFFVLAQPWILEQWALDEKNDPTIYNPPWLLIARENYSYFLWHFLHNYLLQHSWALFCIMLAIGGLSGEADNGSILFTLSLPVARKRLFFERIYVGYIQAAVLALIPVIVLPLFSLFIGLHYNILTARAHAWLFITGGLVFYSIGTLINSIVKTEVIAFFLAIGLVIVFYFLFQPFADGMTKPLILKKIDLAGFMAGNSDGTLGIETLISTLYCIVVSSLLIYASYTITQKKDF